MKLLQVYHLTRYFIQTPVFTNSVLFQAENASLLGKLARTSPQGHSHREDIQGMREDLCMTEDR